MPIVICKKRDNLSEIKILCEIVMRLLVKISLVRAMLYTYLVDFHSETKSSSNEKLSLDYTNKQMCAAPLESVFYF